MSKDTFGKEFFHFPFQNEIQTLYQQIWVEDNKMEWNVANYLTSQFGERALLCPPFLWAVFTLQKF